MSPGKFGPLTFGSEWFQTSPLKPCVPLPAGLVQPHVVPVAFLAPSHRGLDQSSLGTTASEPDAVMEGLTESVDSVSKSKSRKQRRQRLRLAVREASLLGQARPDAQKVAGTGESKGSQASSDMEEPCCESSPVTDVGQASAAAPAARAERRGKPRRRGKASLSDADSSGSSAYGRLRGRVANFAFDGNGCRVLQQTLEELPREQQELLSAELKGQSFRCAEHQHANFVLQQLIELLPPASLRFVASEFKGKAKRLALHECGCRVLQRLLEYWPLSQLAPLLEELLENIHEVSSSKYGNHVMQAILQHGSPEDQVQVITAVRADIYGFATDRFASRVFERLVETVNSRIELLHLHAERAALVESVFVDAKSTSRPLLQELVNHRYGNYVVQQFIKHCKGCDRDRVLCALENIVTPGKSLNKHVAAALAKELARRAPAEAGPASHMG